MTQQQPGDGLDNDCDERIDEEIRDGKDNDGDGRIDEDLDLVSFCQRKSSNQWSIVLNPSKHLRLVQLFILCSAK